MERGRLAPVVLFLHTESYHGGETPPPHKQIVAVIFWGVVNFFGGGVFVMLEIIAPRINVKQICDYENEMHLFRENGDCKRRDCG